MFAISLIGALLLFCGVVYMARAAIYRGRMSDPQPNADDTADVTLEPRRQGTRFLGVKGNRAGLLMIAIGALLLLLPMLLATPES